MTPIFPEGPRIEKNQSREAILKKSSFQYGMKFSMENGFFIPGPSLTAAKQGPGLKFSIENENFKLRMKISSENENFVRGGMAFSCAQARMNFFDPGALWVVTLANCWSHSWKDTKEYLNQRGTKIRVFRLPFRAPFLPPLFPHFSPLFPLQALFTLPPPLPSSPPPFTPLF